MAEEKKLNHEEEANPLLKQQPPQQPPKAEQTTEQQDRYLGWTADGLPMSHGSVMGQPIPRSPWNSSACACLGQNDHFCSSDLEVCMSLSFISLLIYFILFYFVYMILSLDKIGGFFRKILGFNFSCSRIHPFVRTIIQRLCLSFNSAAKILPRVFC